MKKENPINDCKELDLMIKDTLNDLCERVYIDYRRFHMKESCKDYLSHSESKCFNEILFSFIDEKGVKDSEIYKKVDIDRKLFSKIIIFSELLVAVSVFPSLTKPII